MEESSSQAPVPMDQSDLAISAEQPVSQAQPIDPPSSAGPTLSNLGVISSSASHGQLSSTKGPSVGTALGGGTKGSASDSKIPSAKATAVPATRPKSGRAAAPAPAAETSRRHSKRNVKRRKFDDELVESSLNKSSRTRVNTEPSEPSLAEGHASLPSVPTTVNQSQQSTGGRSLLASDGPLAHSLSQSGAMSDGLAGSGYGAVGASFSSSAPGELNSLNVSEKKKGSRAGPPKGAGGSARNLKALASGASLSGGAPAAPGVGGAPGPSTSHGAGGPSGAARAPTGGRSGRSRTKKGVKAGAGGGAAGQAAPVPTAGSSAAVLTASKEYGLWKPQDDLLLIQSVQQTCDLDIVHVGVKFSMPFTLTQIKERWFALLYNPAISRSAMNGIQQLPPDIIQSIESKALFSMEEEAVLKSLPSNVMPTLSALQDLLDANPETFCTGRTAKSLRNHWQLLKRYCLLSDQKTSLEEPTMHFSDMEDSLVDGTVRGSSGRSPVHHGDGAAPVPYGTALNNELSLSDRRHKREISHLEMEIPKWHAVVDNVTAGVSPPEFDAQTLAVLRGRLVRYLMRSREITFGRSAKEVRMDVDLSLEGPAAKVSRRQGTIKLKANGEFVLSNEGKRPVFVDGRPVLSKSKQKLNNNAVVEISCLKFVFLINHDMINNLRNEQQK